MGGGADGSMLWGSIGGGNIERIAGQTAITIKDPKLISYDIGEYDDNNISEALVPSGMICGGSMTLFYEPMMNVGRPKVWVFGAGHCGRAVYNLLSRQDWQIIMLDSRKDVLIPEHFPKAERRLGSYEELANAAEFA